MCGFKKRLRLNLVWILSMLWKKKVRNWKWKDVGQPERIGKFELDKTSCLVFILHSRRFRLVVGLWFFMFFLRFFTLKYGILVSFSYFTFWFIFSFWYDWLFVHICWIEEKWVEIDVIINWISWITYLFILINDIL